MTDSEIFERLGSLEDANLYGFIWQGTDLHINLDGSGFSELVCHWAYDLVINLSWESKKLKIGGPILSMSGHLAKLNQNELKLTLDFGNGSYLSVICGEITVVD